MGIIVNTIDPRTGELGEQRVETEDALVAERAVREQGLWVDSMRSDAPPAQVMPTTSQRPQLIEQTSKRFKMAMLVSAGVAVLSVPTCMVAGLDETPAGKPGVVGMFFLTIGNLMFLGGIAGFVVARIMAWWNHG